MHRLQVLVYQAGVSEASAPPFKFLLLIDGGFTIQQMLYEVDKRFTSVYRDQERLNIVRIQDSSMCDLDPIYKVNDVFQQQDIVRVTTSQRIVETFKRVLNPSEQGPNKKHKSEAGASAPNDPRKNTTGAGGPKQTKPAKSLNGTPSKGKGPGPKSVAGKAAVNAAAQLSAKQSAQAPQSQAADPATPSKFQPPASTSQAAQQKTGTPAKPNSKSNSLQGATSRRKGQNNDPASNGDNLPTDQPKDKAQLPELSSEEASGNQVIQETPVDQTTEQTAEPVLAAKSKRKYKKQKPEDQPEATDALAEAETLVKPKRKYVKKQKAEEATKPEKPAEPAEPSKSADPVEPVEPVTPAKAKRKYVKKQKAGDPETPVKPTPSSGVEAEVQDSVKEPEKPKSPAATATPSVADLVAARLSQIQSKQPSSPTPAHLADLVSARLAEIRANSELASKKALELEKPTKNFAETPAEEPAEKSGVKPTVETDEDSTGDSEINTPQETPTPSQTATKRKARIPEPVKPLSTPEGTDAPPSRKGRLAKQKGSASQAAAIELINSHEVERKRQLSPRKPPAKSVEKPVEKPAEKSAEKPAERLTEKHAESESSSDSGPESDTAASVLAPVKRPLTTRQRKVSAPLVTNPQPVPVPPQPLDPEPVRSSSPKKAGLLPSLDSLPSKPVQVHEMPIKSTRLNSTARSKAASVNPAAASDEELSSDNASSSSSSDSDDSDNQSSRIPRKKGYFASLIPFANRK